IAGGTITFAVGGTTSSGLTIAQILESGLNTTYTVPCGGFVAGAETCQGATTIAGPGGVVATPTPSNVVHVGLRPGVTFSLIGGASPAIPIQATYNRLAAYGAAFSISTNQATIALATPAYAMSLTPSPASIPAAMGSTTGSTITASLQHVTGFQ